MKRTQFLALAFLLCCFLGTKAQTFSIVSKANTDKDGGSPSNFITIGSVTYFVITNHFTPNYELWKTSGGFTDFVKGFPVKYTPNGGYYDGPGIYNLTNLNGTLVFAADNNISGLEWWKTDGTEAGTVIIRDLNANAASGVQLFAGFQKPLVIGSYLYFVGDSQGYGTEIYRTDGTYNGTVLLKDISSSNNNYGAGWLTNVNGTLYFEANDGNGYQIWKSDGTTTGTVKVTNGSYNVPSELTNVNGTLFFSNGGKDLYKTDGTAAGTAQVKTIPRLRDLTAYNGNLYFAADDSTSNGNELWKSDGTEAGTGILKDIYPGSGPSNPASFVTAGIINSLLYFTALSPAEGRELWKTDGTPLGTTIVKDIAPGIYNGLLLPVLGATYGFVVGSVNYSYTTVPSTIFNSNNVLYFGADDGINGNELWKTDGTEAGTTMVINITGDAKSSFPTNITNGFFSASNGIDGFELWKTLGHSSSTSMVQNIVWQNEQAASSLNSSQSNQFAAINGSVYFTGSERRYGGEPYKTNGTLAGTSLIKDIHASGHSSNARDYTAMGSTVFFVATSELGTELWKTDGTTAGTTIVKDIRSGNLSSDPINLFVMGSTLFFSANDGINGAELWKSDGTTAGTLMVKDITTGSAGSGFQGFTNLNGKLYFVCTEPVNGQELWTSDGTAAGTQMVKNIGQGPAYGIPGAYGPLIVMGSNLYFVGVDGTAGGELWKSDGTAAGTVMVKDIWTGVNGSYPNYLTKANNLLYFYAYDPTNGGELYRTDGTTAGTVLVKDIVTGSGSSNPSNLTAVGDIVYFSATTATYGQELYKTDGTAAGTAMVKDISPGTASNYMSTPVKVGPWIYFYAFNNSGYDLWKSDGTSANTTKLTDFEVGGDQARFGSSLLFLSGNILYAVPNTRYSGIQLWAANVSSLLPVQDILLSAELKNRVVEVNWKTANETNLNYYSVQRSIDGTNFYNVGKVTAKGGGSYLFADSVLPTGATKLYYRLQNNDKDGSFEYSKSVAVSLNSKSQFSIYPNPTTDFVRIEGSRIVQATITDNVGKLVATLKMDNPVSFVSMNVGSLAKGLYFINITDANGKSESKKILMQ